jgi:hypothetical protein
MPHITCNVISTEPTGVHRSPNSPVISTELSWAFFVPAAGGFVAAAEYMASGEIP